MKKMKGSTMLAVSMTMVMITIILIGLVSVLPGVSTAAYAMHAPPDTWPWPDVHSELEEAHDVLEHDLGIDLEDVEHIIDNEEVDDSEIVDIKID
jgi:hypothetical protein